MRPILESWWYFKHWKYAEFDNSYLKKRYIYSNKGMQFEKRYFEKICNIIIFQYSKVEFHYKDVILLVQEIPLWK